MRLGETMWGSPPALIGRATHRFRAKSFPYYKPHRGYAKTDENGKG